MAKNYAVEAISSLPFGMLIGAPLTAAIEAQTQSAKATVDFILQVGFLPPDAVAPDANGVLVLDPDPNPVDLTQPDIAPPATQNPRTDAGKARMVTFTYTTSNEDTAAVAAAEAQARNAAGNDPQAQADAAAAAAESMNQVVSISVPILTVVPIPFLSIDELTIDFVAKINEVITATSKRNSETVKSASAQGGGGWGPVSGSFKAGMSSTHSSTAERSSKYQTELTMSIHVRASSESMPKGMARLLDLLTGLIRSERAPTT